MKHSIEEGFVRGRKGGLKIVFAGGGTGGHLAPGIAVAETLVDSVHSVECLFLTTGRSIERRFVDRHSFRWVSFGEGGGSRLGTAVAIGRALFAASAILRRFRPHVIVGLGGACAVGPILASRCLPNSPPVVLLEQNCVPGKATRFLARYAQAVYASLPMIEGRLRFASKVQMTGNPIRRCAVALDRGRAIEALGLDVSRRTLSVLGGSQGASGLNRAVIESLSSWDCSVKNRIQVVHLTGERDRGLVVDAYRTAGVSARVFPFLDEMGRVYGASDLILARSGGTTVAEIEAAAVPSVLVPYPHHRDEHQLHNAGVLLGLGSAFVVSESRLSDSFSQNVLGLLFDEKRLAVMGQRARAGRRDSASEIIAREIVEIAGIAGGRTMQKATEPVEGAPV